jgi:hypothetical protein
VLAAIIGGVFLRGNGTLVWILIGVAGACLLTVNRRIDLDDEALILVPLVPILPKQRIEWREIGPFGPKRYLGSPIPILRATLSRRFRSGNLFPSSTLGLAAYYGASYTSPTLSLEQLRTLLEGYRSNAPIRRGRA